MFENSITVQVCQSQLLQSWLGFVCLQKNILMSFFVCYANTLKNVRISLFYWTGCVHLRCFWSFLLFLTWQISTNFEMSWGEAQCFMLYSMTLLSKPKIIKKKVFTNVKNTLCSLFPLCYRVMFYFVLFLKLNISAFSLCRFGMFSKRLPLQILEIQPWADSAFKKAAFIPWMNSIMAQWALSA